MFLDLPLIKSTFNFKEKITFHISHKAVTIRKVDNKLRLKYFESRKIILGDFLYKIDNEPLMYFVSESKNEEKIVETVYSIINQ